MKWQVPDSQLNGNIISLLKRSHYFLLDQKDNELNFIRRLSKSNFYPRWHLYVKKVDGNWRFSLHLDQKKPSYAGCTAHSAEYEDDMVKEELDRIMRSI